MYYYPGFVRRKRGSGLLKIQTYLYFIIYHGRSDKIAELVE